MMDVQMIMIKKEQPPGKEKKVATVLAGCVREKDSRTN
jgi:hypothetical protein